MTVKEAAKLTDPPVSEVMLRRYCQQERIEGVRQINGGWVFTRAAFDQWQAQRKQRGRPIEPHSKRQQAKSKQQP